MTDMEYFFYKIISAKDAPRRTYANSACTLRNRAQRTHRRGLLGASPIHHNHGETDTRTCPGVWGTPHPHPMPENDPVPLSVCIDELLEQLLARESDPDFLRHDHTHQEPPC